MDAVSIHDAKTHFSRLVARAAAGEEIVVRRGSTPVAKLVPYTERGEDRRPGRLRGEIQLGAEFDTPLEDFAGYTP